jgi:predicted PurR-regulated permease PerM
MNDYPNNRDSPRRLIAWTIAVVVSVALALYALYLARYAVLLVYVSFLFAAGFSPLVRVIERQQARPIGRRLPRWLAILTVYLAILGVLSAVALMVVPPLAQQAQELWTRLPGLVDDAQDWLIARDILNHRLTIGEAVRQAPGSTGDAAGALLSAVWGVAGGLFGIVTILILTFYLLVESDHVFNGFVRLFPRSRRAQVRTAARAITEKVSAWLNGQLILAGTIGTTAAIGLGLMQVPYFYVLALIAAVGEIIPIVGPVLSAIPAVLVALSVSPKLGLFVALFWIVQQQIENHILVPKIMQRQVGVSPVLVIVALLIGGSLLGIVGALLAVPTAAILQVIALELLDERDEHALEP